MWKFLIVALISIAFAFISWLGSDESSSLIGLSALVGGLLGTAMVSTFELGRFTGESGDSFKWALGVFLVDIVATYILIKLFVPFVFMWIAAASIEYGVPILRIFIAFLALVFGLGRMIGFQYASLGNHQQVRYEDVAFDLKNRYKITISEDELYSLKTAGDFFRFIEERIGNGACFHRDELRPILASRLRMKAKDLADEFILPTRENRSAR